MLCVLCSSSSDVLKAGQDDTPWQIQIQIRSYRNKRIFTLAEANELLPQLHLRFAAVRRAKTVIAGTKDEVSKASAQAASGGGPPSGLYTSGRFTKSAEACRPYTSLAWSSKTSIWRLCDFPYKLADRIVYLCWKFGEGQISWWHETSCGYKDRRPLDGTAA